MRDLSHHDFLRAFVQVTTRMRWQEDPTYYPRYQSRDESVLAAFAAPAPNGRWTSWRLAGGQLALISSLLWGNQASVADIEDSCFPELRERGVDAFVRNIALEDPLTQRSFDAILSEVIEHFPVPGHIPLARLHAMLRPGGLLVCSTPNLYRLRKAVYLLLGRPIFDHFGRPGVRGYGHVLEYSAEHLAWQFREAGFSNFDLQLRDFSHRSSRRGDQLLSLLGSPPRKIPRNRDNLLVVAAANEDKSQTAPSAREIVTAHAR